MDFCNQLFSLESAIYLSNITNRKLILIIKRPLCHCGKCDWNYGKFTDFTITPLDSKLSNCSLKTLNSDGLKLLNIGTHVNILWDNTTYKESFLYDNNTIIVIHNSIKYKFTHVA